MTEAEAQRRAQPSVGDWLTTLSDPDAQELALLALVVLLADRVADPQRDARAVSPRWGDLMPSDLTDEDTCLAARWVHEIDKAQDPTLGDLLALVHPGYLRWPRWWPLFAPEDTPAGHLPAR